MAAFGRASRKPISEKPFRQLPENAIPSAISSPASECEVRGGSRKFTGAGACVAIAFAGANDSVPPQGELEMKRFSWRHLVAWSASVLIVAAGAGGWLRHSQEFAPRTATIRAASPASAPVVAPRRVAAGGVPAQELFGFVNFAGPPLGDGGPATQAFLSWPSGVAKDQFGNVYVAEYYGHTIRKISPSGVITSVGGTGLQGFSGDGGPAIDATFSYPEGLLLDGQGNLFVADSGNNRIRRIAIDGVVTTIAGNGVAASDGDGAAAVEASLNHPYGLAVDASGNLYVSEYDGNRVRRIDGVGRISTVAGTGSAGFAGDGGAATMAMLWRPAGIGVDAGNNLYVADSENSRVRRVGIDATIQTIAGGGIGGPDLFVPRGLTASPAGEIFVADANCRVIRVWPTGQRSVVLEDPYCGYGGEDLGEYVGALAAAPGGALLIADSSSYRLRKLEGGTSSLIAGDGRFRDGDKGEALFSTVTGLSVDGAGNVYVADSYPNNRIRRIEPSGLTSTFAGTGIQGRDSNGIPAIESALNSPNDSVMDGQGRLYIADTLVNWIRRVDLDGTIRTVAGTGARGFSGDGSAATSAKLARPRSVAVGQDGSFYIADSLNHRVRRVGVDGIIQTVAGNGIAGFSGDGGSATGASLDLPSSIALDAEGNLYIADYNNARVRKVLPNGTITTVVGTGTPTAAGIGGPGFAASIPPPTGLAMDADERLLIAANGLYVLDHSGVLTAGGGLRFPIEDVAVAPDGSIYVAGLGGRIDRRSILRSPRSPRAPAAPLPRPVPRSH